jgi:hypothetical protein
MEVGGEKINEEKAKGQCYTVTVVQVFQVGG